MKKFLFTLFTLFTLFAGAQISIPISAATGTVTIPVGSLPQDINIVPTSTPVTLTSNYILTSSATPKAGTWRVTINGPIIFNTHTMSIFGQNLNQNNVSATGAVNWSMEFSVVYLNGTPTIIPTSQPQSFNQAQSLLGNVLQFNSTPLSCLVDTAPADIPIANTSGVPVYASVAGDLTLSAPTSNVTTATISAGAVSTSKLGNLPGGDFWIGFGNRPTPTPITGAITVDSNGVAHIPPNSIPITALNFSVCPCTPYTITIDSAQISTLFSTPITIVPAVGGKTIVPFAAVCNYTYNSAAWATHTTLSLLENTAVSKCMSAPILSQTGSGVSLFLVTNAGQSLVQGQALTISVDAGNPTGGNAGSQVTVTVWVQFF